IQQKYDSSAPDGYKKYETSKALIEGIGNNEVVAVFNPYINVWDNGLFLESPLLKKAIPDDTARKIAFDNIKKYIIDPIESVRGVGSLRNTPDNNEFWDTFTVRLNRGRVFNTQDPIQLLQLYNLLLRRVIAPKELENSPVYMNAQYTIIDKDLSVDKETEKAERETKSYGLYYQLKTTNKEALINILNYIGINVKLEDSDANIDLAFKRYVGDKNNGVTNTKEFIDIAESYSTPKGKQLIGTYQKLKEMYADGTVELRGKTYFLGDIALGNSFKTSARIVVGDTEIKKAFSELLK